MPEKPLFTNANGAPVADNTNIMTAGPRGPALLQDLWLLEKLAHFDREVIPERRMHAKGWGAHGTFTVTQDITRFTKAKIFSTIGKQTSMFVRFSTVAGERGAADAERDIRGTALKFYTEEGNWDIVGNNTPVFFFRDPLRFPDLNHAIKRDPRTGLRSADNNWAEVEQAAFSPANVVPGIGFSPDKMLQARLFSYGDTQRYRLGINFNHIPVNAPKCPFHSYHRDGQMRTDGNLGGTLTFHPNSAKLWDNQPDFAEPPMPVDGDGAHWDHRVDDDHWEQPRNLFRKMTPAQQQALFENTARAMGDARLHIKQRHVDNCTRADPAYGAGVARALGITSQQQQTAAE